MFHKMIVMVALTAIPLAALANESERPAICRAAIATIMSQNPKIIRIDGAAGDVTRLSYNRPSDNKKWSYRCKLVGERVIWASETGRWRDHAMDEKLTFQVTDGEITITELYSDGSKTVKRFHKKELK